MSDLLVRGALYGAEGSTVPSTGGLSGALRTQAAHAEFFDSAYSNRVYSIDSDSVTLAAANASKAALGTAKFIVGFYNPTASRKLAVILNAVVATVSGTPAGPYFYNYFSGVTPTNTETGTIRSGYLGAGSASEMTAETGVVLTVVGGATSALVQHSVLGGPAAIAAGAGIYSIADSVRGQIIVPPGTLFGIMALGAGTTHVVQSTLTWEEVRAL
jgi:hypothetical protein